MSKARVITMRFECNGHYMKPGEGIPRCPRTLELSGTLAEINRRFRQTGWKVKLKSKGYAFKTSETQATNADAHVCNATHIDLEKGWELV